MPAHRTAQPAGWPPTLVWTAIILAGLILLAVAAVVVDSIWRQAVPSTVVTALIVAAGVTVGIFGQLRATDRIGQRIDERIDHVQAEIDKVGVSVRSLRIWLVDANDVNADHDADVLRHLQQTVGMLSECLSRDWNTPTAAMETVDDPDRGQDTSEMAIEVARRVARRDRHAVQPTSGQAPGDSGARLRPGTVYRATGSQEDTAGFGMALPAVEAEAVDARMVDSIEQGSTGGLDAEVIRLGRRISRRIQGDGPQQPG